MNYFFYKEDSSYPKDFYYRPSKKYPEYPFAENGFSEKNDVYDMIRETFHGMGLDLKHYNTSSWNPLGAYIKPGNTVLVKPNLVLHTNTYSENIGTRGLECMVTHPSVIRCVLDYVFIALDGNGKVILGDAPVQECIFKRLMDAGGYHRIEKFYLMQKEEIFHIKFADFRTSCMKRVEQGSIQVKLDNAEYQGKMVKIEGDSYFSGQESKKLRIQNYWNKKTVNAHKEDKHEYCLSDACLMADVIINLPKPKTHRLAGITGAMKNMIGINAKKEYLPHYTIGSVEEGGDSYPIKDKKTGAAYRLADIRNRFFDNQKVWITEFLTDIFWTIRKSPEDKNNGIDFGSWYGNDTIWRTILDVNYALQYAGKSGCIEKKEQRKIVTIGDMIISGERSGPLQPNSKKVNGILFSDYVVEFDYCLAEIMGFDYNKIPYIKNALSDKRMWNGKKIELCSNEDKFQGTDISWENSFRFIAHDGWRNYVEKTSKL